MLSIKNVSYKYNSRAVLNAVSAQVLSGECLAIVGESGSGKSTLLKLIYGEMDVDNGAVFWKENAILGPKDKLVVGHDFMKYVAQEFDLMPYTSVSENIGNYLSNFYPPQYQPLYLLKRCYKLVNRSKLFCILKFRRLWNR